MRSRKTPRLHVVDEEVTLLVRVQEDGLSHHAFVAKRCEDFISSRAKLIGPLADLLE
jgi:hypothetical protein